MLCFAQAVLAYLSCITLELPTKHKWRLVNEMAMLGSSMYVQSRCPPVVGATEIQPPNRPVGVADTLNCTEELPVFASTIV